MYVLVCVCVYVVPSEWEQGQRLGWAGEKLVLPEPQGRGSSRGREGAKVTVSIAGARGLDLELYLQSTHPLL